MTLSPSATPLRILPLGDSITEGSGHQPGGYRGFLEQSLLASGIAFEFVGSQQSNSEGMRYPRHEGYPGASIQLLHLGREGKDSARASIEQTLREFQPDCVLLLAGTNDLYFACPEKSAAEVSELIQKMFQITPNLSVVLGTLLPILPGPKPWGSVVPEDVADRVNQFNGRLARLVQEQVESQKMVLLANFNGCVESAEDLLADGVHPTGRVMERMGKIWHESVIRLLESKVPATS